MELELAQNMELGCEFHLICLARSVEIGNRNYLISTWNFSVRVVRNSHFRAHALWNAIPLLRNWKPDEENAVDTPVSWFLTDIHTRRTFHVPDLSFTLGFEFWVLNHAFLIVGKCLIVLVPSILITMHVHVSPVQKISFSLCST